MSVYLVTGACGWLGSALVEALCGLNPHLRNMSPAGDGDEIRCLCLPGEDSKISQDVRSRVKVFTGDITQPHTLKEFFKNAQGGVVFHIAGVVHPPARTRFFKLINEMGTVNVLSEAEAAGVKRFIHMSSNSPFGFNPSKNHLFDEDSPYNPYMGYGRSKMKAELAVKEFGDKGTMETVIIRSPWFYGPHQPERQTLFFRMIREGKVPVVGDGTNKRSMAYVDNIALGMFLAAKSEKAAGKAYWIADERPYTMLEIIGTIEHLLENEFGFTVAHGVWKLPSWVSPAAQMFDYLIQKAGFYNQKIHVLSEMGRTIACSIEKAGQELGYTPLVSLEEGMRRSIKWCLDNGMTI